MIVTVYYITLGIICAGAFAIALKWELLSVCLANLLIGSALALLLFLNTVSMNNDGGYFFSIALVIMGVVEFTVILALFKKIRISGGDIFKNL